MFNAFLWLVKASRFRAGLRQLETRIVHTAASDIVFQPPFTQTLRQANAKDTLQEKTDQ